MAVVDRLARGAQSGLLPLMGNVALETLGVRRPRHGADGSDRQLAYTRRHRMDSFLHAALTEHVFVLVHGPSAAGKSRSVAEAARTLFGKLRVLVPQIEPNALQLMFESDTITPGAIVWLDDLDRHIDSGVTAAILERIISIDDVRVIATLRSAAYEQIRPAGALRTPGRDVLDLIPHQALVPFEEWDQSDRDEASRQGHARRGGAGPPPPSNAAAARWRTRSSVPRAPWPPARCRRPNPQDPDPPRVRTPAAHPYARREPR